LKTKTESFNGGGIGQLEIVKDQALKLGALILETPYGSVDAGMDTKLKKIEEAFSRYWQVENNFTF